MTAAADIVDVLERAGAAAGWDAWDGAREVPAVETADALGVASEVVGAALLAGATELTPLLLELEGLRRALTEELLRRRTTALLGLQAGLARMRGVESPSALLDLATLEVCRSCGFDRAVLFRVRESQMIIDSAHFTGHEADAERIIEVGQAHPADLNHLLLETEMVRRRMPMLVLDPQNDPRVYREMIDATQTRSYVAAPIMPGGRVIGFLHADRFYSQREVDVFDRDTLWTFAEGFGYAFERTVLQERLRGQREQVRSMLSSTESLVTELCDTEIGVAQLDRTAADAPAPAAPAGQSSRADGLLTRREIEVIRLMASGETNAGIAQRLVISEGTVKSHVKHILRKLRAANRAEAVSRFLRISAMTR